MGSMHCEHGCVGARATALAPGDVVRLEHDLTGVDRPRHAAEVGAGRVPVVPVERADGGRPALQLQFHLQQALVLLHASSGCDRQHARIQLQLHRVTVTENTILKLFQNKFNLSRQSILCK